MYNRAIYDDAEYPLHGIHPIVAKEAENHARIWADL